MREKRCRIRTFLKQKIEDDSAGDNPPPVYCYFFQHLHVFFHSLHIRKIPQRRKRRPNTVHAEKFAVEFACAGISGKRERQRKRNLFFPRDQFRERGIEKKTRVCVDPKFSLLGDRIERARKTLG